MAVAFQGGNEGMQESLLQEDGSGNRHFRWKDGGFGPGG